MLRWIDYLYSGNFYITAIAFLLMFVLFIGVSLSEPFGHQKKRNIAFKVFVYVGVFVGSFIFFYAPSWFGVGLSQRVISIGSEGKYLFAINKRYQGHGEGEIGSYFYRLQKLDKANGKLISRRVISTESEMMASESAEMYYLSPDTLFLRAGKEEILFNAHNLKPLFKFNKQNLQKKVPQFSMGIAAISYQKKDTLFLVKAKNGKEYRLHPLSLQVSPAKASKTTYHHKNQPENTKEYIYLEPDKTLAFSRGVIKKIQLLYRNTETYPDSEPKTVSKFEFLEGKFLHFSQKEQLIIVQHYTTTDQTEVIFTAIALQDLNKKRWEIKQKDLKVYDLFSFSRNFGTSIIDEHSFVFAIDSFLINLDLKTGKLNWKVRI